VHLLWSIEIVSSTTDEDQLAVGWPGIGSNIPQTPGLGDRGIGRELGVVGDGHIGHMLGNQSILSSLLTPLLLRVTRMMRMRMTMTMTMAMAMVLVLAIVGVMVRMRMATIGMATLPFGLLALTLQLGLQVFDGLLVLGSGGILLHELDLELYSTLTVLVSSVGLLFGSRGRRNRGRRDGGALASCSRCRCTKGNKREWLARETRVSMARTTIMVRTMTTTTVMGTTMMRGSRMLGTMMRAERRMVGTTTMRTRRAIVRGKGIISTG
jgi:hypothetical protein